MNLPFLQLNNISVCVCATSSLFIHQWHLGERSSDPIRDWPRHARECPGVSSRGVGQLWPAAGLGALRAAVHAWDLLKEVNIIFITFTGFGLRSNNREGAQPFLQWKIGLKINWARPQPIRTRPSYPSVSLSHQEASVSLLSFSIRGQTDWKAQSQKTNQSDHMRLV